MEKKNRTNKIGHTKAMKDVMELDLENFLVSSLQMENEINSLETFMIQQEQIEIPLIESSKNGMYYREILIPKGTILTGVVHLFDYHDIMLSGDITIATTSGIFGRFSGYNVMDGKAGRKRIGYAHEDTRWLTVHNTRIENDAEFREKLTVVSMKEFREMKLLGVLP